MKILLVEDDMEISAMSKSFLMTENYEVIAVSDGESACEKFFSDDFGLVLLDLMISKRNGMEVMGKIRESSTVPIIIISAKDTDSDKTLGLGLGADDYITKPFSVTEVLARIKANIRRTTQYASGTSMQQPVLIPDYICILVDIYNREIIGYSAGEHKTAELVKKAFQRVEGNLADIRLFHTDRGNEFKNQTIEELLEAFDIGRSLSQKGCPYDNAVAEATFKIIKTEFVWKETFADLKELKLKLWDYVNWYNHHRIHSALGYQTPVQYRENNLKKVV